MKKLAARDFENLLQVREALFYCRKLNETFVKCAIPVFDGLLPEPHNRRVLQLLFVAAHWHGLAKLRMHTDATIDKLEAVTQDLGKKFRDFKKMTCAAFETRELQREFNARMRRQNQRARPRGNPAPTTVQNSTERQRVGLDSAHDSGVSSVPQSLPSVTQAASNTVVTSRISGRQMKTLNLNTYKHHALGDYASTIRKYGTTDSYSTERVRRSLLNVGGFTHLTVAGRVGTPHG
jgi:hypothetical protein